MKKITIRVFFSIALLLLFVLSWQLYLSHHPNVHICRNISDNSATDNYRESIMIITEDRSFLLPNDSSFENNMREIADWNNHVDKKIHEYDLALSNHVTVSGEVGDGQTTLRYEGYLTDSNGKRVELLEEKTFDFVPDKVLFD